MLLGQHSLIPSQRRPSSGAAAAPHEPSQSNTPPEDGYTCPHDVGQREPHSTFGMWMGRVASLERASARRAVVTTIWNIREDIMAQAALKSHTDVVDFLVSQHEQIKSPFAATLSSSGKDREKAFVELRRLLAVHETAEEEIVHPRAKRKIPNGAALVGARLAEENEAKKVLTELEKLDADSEAFTSQLAELYDAVIDHAEHEETEEFAKLGEELSDDELERMGRAAARAEAIAPTRPHAGIESQVANLLAGPFAAMMDRARDAITSKG